MSVFEKLLKESVETDLSHSIDIDSHMEPTERAIKRIIDGKLYDTSRATKICSVVVPEDEILNSKLHFCTLGGDKWSPSIRVTKNILSTIPIVSSQ